VVQLHTALEQEFGSRNDGGVARRRARNIHRRIYDDDGGDHPSLFARVSQNVAAAAILLWTVPKPLTLEGWQAHEELCALLDRVAIQ
jgi:hypothetical protein